MECTDNLSNHELAKRYMNKAKVIGKEIIDIRLLSNDRVMLVEVFDKESTGMFVIPKFITEFMQIRQSSGRFVQTPLFEQCQFSEVRFENNPDILLDACRLFSNMESTNLKVRFAHPECLIITDRMFENCVKLCTLDLDGFNTENVNSMTNMFNNCKSLKNLYLRGFNTSKVRNMSGMFCRCYGLESLDLSEFSTESVENMATMFYACTNLKELNVKSFNTCNLSNTEAMFNGCTSIKSIDIENFDLSSIENAKYMFSWCKNLETIKLGKFNPKANLESITSCCDKLVTRI